MDNRQYLEEVRHFYNSIEHIWAPDDAWHQATLAIITKLIRQSRISPSDYILNAGSGGNGYHLPNRMKHLDIAEDKISGMEDFIVSGIDEINLPDRLFDTVLCVGSVLNYADPESAIGEFSRLLRASGRLILEFESSCAFEYFGKDAYQKDSHIIHCNFQNCEHEISVFNPEHIERLLTAHGFQIECKTYFQILSSLALNWNFSEKAAARLTCMDALCRLFPFMRKHGCNVFYICRRIS